MQGMDAQPLRVIGYCRVSTDEQAMSGLGLADQEKRIREMAKPHGWRITQVIRDEGRPTGRPAVVDDQALVQRIKDMREGEMTLRQIADALNAERVPTMRGAKLWQPSAIQTALGYKRPRKARRIAELPAAR